MDRSRDVSSTNNNLLGVYCMNYLSIKSSLSKAKNSGASGSGSHHWFHQRLTSIMMIIILPWFFYVMHKLSSMELSGMIESLREPYNLTPIMILLIITFYHGSLGMQVIIEDYIHVLWVRNTLIISIKLFSIITVISGILALLSLMVF